MTQAKRKDMSPSDKFFIEQHLHLDPKEIAEKIQLSLKVIRPYYNKAKKKAALEAEKMLEEKALAEKQTLEEKLREVHKQGRQLKNKEGDSVGGVQMTPGMSAALGS